MYSPVFGHYGCLWVSLWVYPAGTPPNVAPVTCGNSRLNSRRYAP